MKDGRAGEIMAGRKQEISIVSEDQNWRSYVSNELKCADQWNKDWGFLATHDGKQISSVEINFCYRYRRLPKTVEHRREDQETRRRLAGVES